MFLNLILGQAYLPDKSIPMGTKVQKGRDIYVCVRVS